MTNDEESGETKHFTAVAPFIDGTPRAGAGHRGRAREAPTLAA